MIRLGGLLVAVVMLIAMGSPVRLFGQTAACSSETTTAGMRECENLRYERAQKDVDTVYAELMKKLDDAGRVKLRSAQTAWAQFRQAEAEFEADQARGGTLAPLIKITVMADLTEARVSELKKSLQH